MSGVANLLEIILSSIKCSKPKNELTVFVNKLLFKEIIIIVIAGSELIQVS